MTKQEEEKFGYPQETERIRQDLDKSLESEIKAMVAGDLSDYAIINVKHKRNTAGLSWEPILPLLQWNENLPFPHSLEENRNNVDAMLREDPNCRISRLYKSYFENKGFDYRETRDNSKDGCKDCKSKDCTCHCTKAAFEIAYKKIADRARKNLKICYDVLTREAGGGDERRLQELLLAALQEMPFELPPEDDDKLKLHKAGFWGPAQVLSYGKGDCDSKSAAFCGLSRLLQKCLSPNRPKPFCNGLFWESQPVAEGIPWRCGPSGGSGRT